MSDVQTRSEQAPLAPVGIGGWLILPVIGLCITPIRGLLSVAEYSGLFSSFSVLSTAQSSFVVVEILVNFFLLVVAPIYLIYLLFNKKRTFPGMYARWGIASLVFIVIDLIIAAILFHDVFSQPDTPLFDEETVKEIARSVILVAIWVPYMLNSRRVANTFVR